MSKRHHLFSTTALTVLLVCSFACAQENSNAPGTSKEKQPPEPNQVEKVLAQAEPAAKETDLEQGEVVKVSEAFGHFIGRNLKNPGLQFDLDSIIKGMRAGYSGEPAPLSDQEYEELMAKLQEKAYNQIADDNLKAAEEFLTANTSTPNLVEVVPHELQYVILQEGSGATVKEHDSPQIHYVGQFIDGTVFGSSEETGGPIVVPLDQTIPGFSKGIIGMKEGEKRRLFVHPNLGYGTSGHLPPNSLLIFDIELVKANASDSSQSEQDLDSGLSLNDSSDKKDQDDDDLDDDDSDDSNDDDEDEEDVDENPKR